MSTATVTTDHDEIRKWAEKHGGKPAAVKKTHRGGDVGIIRIMFPKAANSEHDALEEISWEEWFEAFEGNALAFLYQEETKDGGETRFSKLVSR